MRGRALKALKASEMRAPLREPSMTRGGAGAGEVFTAPVKGSGRAGGAGEAFRAPVMEGAGGGAGGMTAEAFEAPNMKGT